MDFCKFLLNEKSEKSDLDHNALVFIFPKKLCYHNFFNKINKKNGGFFV